MDLIRRRRAGRLAVLTLDRVERHNTLDRPALLEIHRALDDAEADPGVLAVVFEGQGGVFCTGMDLQDIDGAGHAPGSVEETARLYFRTLRRLTRSPKLIVAVVDGRAEAGGVGLVAASDWAVASERSTFRLPEVLLGLLPASVLPFLVRRAGPQKSFVLSLTAETLDAEGARALGLVDQVAGDVGEALRRFALKIDRVPAATLATLKAYTDSLWDLPDATEERAVSALTGALADPAARGRIREVLRHDLWQRER